MDLHSKVLYPLLVSHVQGVEDTPEVREMVWGKARRLPQDVQELLLSDEIKIYILETSQKSDLDEVRTEQFSRLIRTFFFGDDSPENIAPGIGLLFGKDSAFGHTILTEIQSLEVTGETLESYSTANAQTTPNESLTLEAAYKKYPQVLTQLVTTNKIVSKPFLEPLSPTVKNWITVYEKLYGVKTHDDMERGEFLYRSQACRGINDVDRSKLSQLLSARDDGSELLFDTTMGGIIWQNKAVQAPETLDVGAGAEPTIANTRPEVKIKSRGGINDTTVSETTEVTPPTPVNPEVSSERPFTPSIGRRRHGAVNESGDPQIVTRPRTTLGASSHVAASSAVTPNSNPESVAPKPPQFVGSAKPSEPISTPPSAPLPSANGLQTNTSTPGMTKPVEPVSVSPTAKDDLQVNFSSGQTLPAEKAKGVPENQAVPKEQLQPTQTATPRRSPFKMNPMGRG